VGWTARAELTNAMCVNACGKFPHMRRACVSYSFGSSLTSLLSESNRLNSASAAPAARQRVLLPAKTARQEGAFLGQTIDVTAGRTARHQAIHEQGAFTAAMVPATRGSSAGGNRTGGINNRLASK
jgi:hypothetical protein